jgi:uncharacterized DUF497 family protein
MALRFEWDAAKAQRNQAKHRVDFHEASTIFGDAMAITIFDPLHSDREDRFVTIGLADSGRLLTVIHTDRADTIRLISARNATAKEIQTYERQA